MRHLFQAMFGLSVGIVGAGLAAGVHLREVTAGAVGQAEHAAPAAQAATIGAEVNTRPSLEDALTPPEPLLPRYAERVPWGGILAWSEDARADGARLELSTSPRFDPGTVRHADIDGDRFKVPSSVAPGVWYWRVRARAEGVVGERASPARMMFVTAASAGDWG